MAELESSKISAPPDQAREISEAMDITGQAKALFQETDIIERGQRLIDKSLAAGVTHMRAFVEVDPIVDKTCLQAGVKLKQTAEDAGKCIVQICAFPQLPLFTTTGTDHEGVEIRKLMHIAAQKRGVDVLGSTPYVEDTRDKMKANVEWTIDLAIQYILHLDFHLDYNADPNEEPLVWHVVRTLKARNWTEQMPGRTIVPGHCTRLSMLTAQQWGLLREEIESHGAEISPEFARLTTVFDTSRSLPATAEHLCSINSAARLLTVPSIDCETADHCNLETTCSLYSSFPKSSWLELSAMTLRG